MSTQEKILAIVKQLSGKDAAPDLDESLFESGYLDSFALQDMVSALETEFGISVPDSDLSPRKFESVSRIESYLASRA
jgi:D-alanine--poly(phosphoribitol) ligase subunit 2